MSFRKKHSLADVTNISYYKPDEEALKKSEANLRTIFDNTDTAYILFSSDLKILSFNALAQKYSEENNGVSLKINKHINEYFAPERWPIVVQMLERASAGEIVDYELNLAKEDESPRWYNVRWLNVKNSDNKKWGYILANKDVTEAKVAELEREKITADLTQHNNDLEQFTYIVSHNLRAPVANILGLADMLKEHDQDFDTSTKKEVADRIYVSIKNIDTIIKDLNDILQARKPVDGKKENVDFETLVNTVKTSVRNNLVDEQVKFVCDFTAIDSMYTIRSYLYSIFYNLTSNSIKYRQIDVPPVVSITSGLVNDKIELRFKDNGKGIDLDKNGQNIFGLYKRFDTSVEGKGMGLFMVKTQVAALGGTISIESKLGEGTEFILQFNQQD